MIRVHENAQLRALASAVITGALRDVTTRKQPREKRLAALVWLLSPDFEIWCDFADYTVDPYKILPCLRKVKRQLQTRRLK